MELFEFTGMYGPALVEHVAGPPHSQVLVMLFIMNIRRYLVLPSTRLV